MLFGAVATALAAASPPPTLREHTIASGLQAHYLDGNWTATHSSSSSDSDARPPLDAVAAWATPLPATVPGDILTDLQAAGRTPDPYFNSTWLQPGFIATWNQGLWTYSTTFGTTATAKGEAAAAQQLLVFDGIRMGAMISVRRVSPFFPREFFVRFSLIFLLVVWVS